MGLNNLPRIAMYWSTDPFIGNTGIQNVMTKNRFEELSQYLHFANSETEPQREDANYDRLFKIRPILSIVLENNQNAYEPSKNLSVDEAMIAFKGRLSFRQYMPAKPTKYGIKVWMAADSQNGYVTNFSVYLGQETFACAKHVRMWNCSVQPERLAAMCKKEASPRRESLCSTRQGRIHKMA